MENSTTNSFCFSLSATSELWFYGKYNPMPVSFRFCKNEFHARMCFGICKYNLVLNFRIYHLPTIFFGKLNTITQPTAQLDYCLNGSPAGQAIANKGNSYWLDEEFQLIHQTASKGSLGKACSWLIDGSWCSSSQQPISFHVCEEDL